MGQIEIDELYIGMDKRGCHYVIPVQAKRRQGPDRDRAVNPGHPFRRAEISRHALPGHRCTVLGR